MRYYIFLISILLCFISGGVILETKGTCNYSVVVVFLSSSIMTGFCGMDIIFKYFGINGLVKKR